MRQPLSRAKARVVHCNNGLEASRFVVTELDLFVVIEFGMSKYQHYTFSLLFLALKRVQTAKSVS